MYVVNRIVIASAFILGIAFAFQNCGEPLDLTTAQLGSENTPQGSGPVIISAPGGNRIWNEGLNFSEIVVATGSSLKYQWLKNGSAIAGATNSIFQGGPVTLADAGSYSVQVWNDFGNEALFFTVTVNPSIGGTPTPTPTLPPGVTPTLTPTPTPVISGPAIVTGVQAVSAKYSDSGNPAVRNYWIPANLTDSDTSDYNLVQFSVVASGTGLSYQWYHVDYTSGQPVKTNISGATQASYSFRLISLNQLGSYGVDVSNGSGSTSSQASLTVPQSGEVTASVPYTPGSPTGTAFDLSCPASENLIGFSVTADSSKVHLLESKCGNPNFTRYLTPQGASTGTFVDQTCSALNPYVVGVNIRNSGLDLEYLQTKCGDESGVNVTTLAGAGNQTGTLRAFTCPAWHVVNRIKGFTYMSSGGGGNMMNIMYFQVFCKFVLP